MKPTMKEFNQRLIKLGMNPKLIANIAKDMIEDMNTPISTPNKREENLIGIRIDNSPVVASYISFIKNYSTNNVRHGKISSSILPSYNI